MKKAFVILATLVAVSSLSCRKEETPTPPPTNNNVDLKKGLLLYLPFDGNIADSSGNGNQTMAINGTVLTNDEHGYSNSAFGSTGAGQAILVTNNGSINFDTAFSLSFDFSVRCKTGQLMTFLSMVDYATAHGPTFNVGLNVPNVPYFHFSANALSSGSCGDFGTHAPLVRDTTGFIPATDSWYNATCIFHKGSASVYINGVLQRTVSDTSFSKANICPNSQLVVGGWWRTDPESINGKLDNIRLYNRVLNTNEIAELAKEFQQ